MDNDTKQRANDTALLLRAIQYHSIEAEYALDVGDVGSERLHRYLAGSLETQLRNARRRERRA
jgi:hypothetical protein